MGCTIDEHNFHTTQCKKGNEEALAAFFVLHNNVHTYMVYYMQLYSNVEVGLRIFHS